MFDILANGFRFRTPFFDIKIKWIFSQRNRWYRSVMFNKQAIVDKLDECYV